MNKTRVVLLPDPSGRRARLDLGCARPTAGGALRARLLGLGPASARVALVPEGALLLRDDEVSVDLVVGEGVHLEIIEPSGTVAYDMRGGSARWDVQVRVESGGRLTWQAQPFVLAEGADVRRRMSARLADDAALLHRETLVLGRSGEGAGRLQLRTDVTRGDVPVLVEELALGSGEPTVGVLGPHRVVDTLLSLGRPDPAAVPALPGTATYRLAGGGTMWRTLTDASHCAGLGEVWQILAAA